MSTENQKSYELNQNLLSPMQFGIQIRLLWYYHLCSGKLKASSAELEQICGCCTEPEVKALQEMLRVFWRKTEKGIVPLMVPTGIIFTAGDGYWSRKWSIDVVR